MAPSHNTATNATAKTHGSQRAIVKADARESAEKKEGAVKKRCPWTGRVAGMVDPAIAARRAAEPRRQTSDEERQRDVEVTAAVEDFARRHLAKQEAKRGAILLQKAKWGPKKRGSAAGNRTSTRSPTSSSGNALRNALRKSVRPSRPDPNPPTLMRKAMNQARGLMYKLRK